MSSAPGASNLTGYQNNTPHTFDTTGQVAPPGMKPRVTATLWEDEGSLCFQVEAKGVCVARREGMHVVLWFFAFCASTFTPGRSPPHSPPQKSQPLHSKYHTNSCW